MPTTPQPCLSVPLGRLVVLCLWAAVVLTAIQPASAQSGSTIRVRLADGFDFPVGKPDAEGYYKARGYWPNGHLGEDWNGRGGGDSDLGAPIYSMGRGVVILSQNIGVGWGNCVLIRHIFREADGRIAMVDSLYGHLHERKVKLHELVEKGQLVGTMGGNNGMYAGASALRGAQESAHRHEPLPVRPGFVELLQPDPPSSMRAGCFPPACRSTTCR
jgi:murein DD-endopeptidase MepM/ murein hydrolase activator NlpD